MAQISKRWKHRLICSVLAAGAAAATLALDQVKYFHQLHLKALDTHFVVRGGGAPKDVMLVLADQKSLDTIPDLQMFWHPHYAAAIRAAAGAGAKVLGLDVTFAIPVDKWEPKHDQMLAEAVGESVAVMPVVCGYVPAAMEKQKDWPVPINMLAAALGLGAYANLTVDPDDFVRRQEVIERPDPKDPERPLVRGLAVRVAEKFLDKELNFKNGVLMLGDQPLPVVSERTILINHAGPPGTVNRVSLSDFIQAAKEGKKEQLEKWVKGKAVFIGPDNSVEDRHATPYYTKGGDGRWNTAGVEIQAATANTLITGAYLKDVPAAARIAAVAAAAGVTMGIVIPLAAKVVAWWLAGMGLVVAVGTHMLFRAGWVLSTSEMFLSGFLALLSGLAYRYLTAEKRGNLFASAVRVFVGKQVESTLEESQQLGLAGSRQFVTILFSDIRGFTAFCESKDPAEVVALLNDYLGTMVSIIVKNHGHVNKFIGDGILAVFSDQDGPDVTPGDHPTRAVRAGTEMAATVVGDFKTGVGIHSGAGVIGNVGSSDKMEYTVLGDTVNVASRLESMNKEQKAKILMSEATAQLADPSLDVMHLTSVSIRGQTKMFELYTVRSLAPEWALEKMAAEQKP